MTTQPFKRGRKRVSSRPNFQRDLLGILPMLHAGVSQVQVADQLNISVRTLMRELERYSAGSFDPASS